MHDHVLTPGRYVGAADEAGEEESFSEKMARLTEELEREFENSERITNRIKKNLESLVPYPQNLRQSDKKFIAHF